MIFLFLQTISPSPQKTNKQTNKKTTDDWVVLQNTIWKWEVYHKYIVKTLFVIFFTNRHLVSYPPPPPPSKRTTNHNISTVGLFNLALIQMDHGLTINLCVQDSSSVSRQRILEMLCYLSCKVFSCSVHVMEIIQR